MRALALSLLLSSPALAADDAPLPVAPDGLKVIHQVEAEFPPSLLGAAGGKSIEYVCTVEVVVERSGVPSAANVVADPACPGAAAAAAQSTFMQWRWAPPTLLNGDIVRASTKLRVRFRETENDGISGRRIGTDSLTVLRAAHAITPDGFPTCNVRVGVDRQGNALQRSTNRADCLVRTDEVKAAPNDVERGMACLLTFESDGGSATAIKVVKCPQAAQRWAKQLVNGWRWLTPTDSRQGYMVALEVLR